MDAGAISLDDGACIRLDRMTQLTEAVALDDDWTGMADSAARRKRQTRLANRAYRRRRKEQKWKAQDVSETRQPGPSTLAPYWIEDEQRVVLLPGPPQPHNPIVPFGPWAKLPPSSKAGSPKTPLRVILPLSADHLIPLLQYNVLRACIANHELIAPILPASDFESSTSSSPEDCSVEVLRVLPAPISYIPPPPPTSSSSSSSSEINNDSDNHNNNNNNNNINDPLSHYALLLSRVPPPLHPTALQLVVPHEPWVDSLPSPVWRDNVLRRLGGFDEDALWSDTMGGLFEGYHPASEIGRRGVMAWGPHTWCAEGWEMSRGFWERWGRDLLCRGDGGEGLRISDGWRARRGEGPLLGGGEGEGDDDDDCFYTGGGDVCESEHRRHWGGMGR